MNVFLLLILCICVGCQSNNSLGKAPGNNTVEKQSQAATDAYAYHFPKTTAYQMQKCIKCTNKVLMIPIALPNWPTDNTTAVLETPVETTYPFDNLPKLSGYQYVTHGYSWTVGPKGILVAFLLIDTDGNVYLMDTPDAPFGEDRDIAFHKACMSQDWKSDFSLCLNKPKWSNAPSFWQLPDGAATTYSWRNPETDSPKLNGFCKYFPVASTETNGKWEQIVQPCFTPNVFCERNLHSLPSLSATSVLLLRPRITIENISADDSYEEIDLAFPNGKIIGNIADMKRELDALWRSGRYSVLAYDRRMEKELRDPERAQPWAPDLRTYAADNGIPLVILYGEDRNAPLHEGLPKQIRQFWQCPQCISSQMTP